MKALFSFLSCLIMLALFTRCADDELDGPSDGLPDKGLVVRLSTGGGLETKTTLNSTGAYHHVQEVWAVLYKLDASATDPTNNENYDFVTAEKLDWNPSKPAPDRSEYPSEEAYRAAYEQYVLETGGAYGNGSPQQKDFELHSDENGTLLDAGIYRVLCVGLDDMSGTVYNLKTGDQLNEEIFATGKTLADAVATITNIENAFEGELFAGWAEFQFEPDNLNIVEVEMKRRVAGVLCYVTDIPRVITNSGGDQLVKGIRLVLNTQANNQVHLCRPVQPYEENNGNKTYTDFGDFVSEGYQFDEKTTVLATYDLSAYVMDTDNPAQMDKGDIFTWEEQTTTSGTKIKANSLLMGAYLLPVKEPENGATLSVELLGGSSYKAEDLTAPTATTVLATFNATRSGVEEADVTSYDILPNYIYHIGNKPEPDGTDKDEPVSLLGQKITVTPEPWKGQDVINVEYPSVPLLVTMEYPHEIFDCVKSEFNIDVNESVLKNHWHLHIDGDGLYVKNQSGSYVQDYYSLENIEAEEGATLSLVWVDYINENSSEKEDPANDYRTATITLSTLDKKEGQPINSMSKEIKQYNAIIVPYGNETRGFRRLNGDPTGWGYWSPAATASVIYFGASADYDDGKNNYINASSKDEDGYEGSLIQRSYLPIYKVESGALKAQAEYWYLPAPKEMNTFLDLAKKNSWLEVLDVKIYSSNASQNKYWSSVGRWEAKSEANYITLSGDAEYSLVKREEQLYTRQACHIPSASGN